MRNITTYLVILITFFAMSVAGQGNFHQFTVKDINGSDFYLGSLKGKKVLVLNTASKCGLTPQYEDLERLYREYGKEGLVIVGFPSNDFGEQEPGTDEEIAAFCTARFDVTFPMMSKISVKGEEMHPVYKWLTSASENGLEDSKVSWNFQKYMIDEQGNLVGHVPPAKKPYCKEIIDWLKKG
jgi:glutathione peroxidase